jgi:hypothetical protein
LQAERDGRVVTLTLLSGQWRGSAGVKATSRPQSVLKTLKTGPEPTPELPYILFDVLKIFLTFDFFCSILITHFIENILKILKNQIYN